MPYNNLSELPESVQGVLPEHAQEIYKEALTVLMNSTRTPKNDATMLIAKRWHTGLRGQP